MNCSGSFDKLANKKITDKIYYKKTEFILI